MLLLRDFSPAKSRGFLVSLNYCQDLNLGLTAACIFISLLMFILRRRDRVAVYLIVYKPDS